jgi:hypothetical protein
MTTVFTDSGVRVYQAATLKSGLKLYAATGIKPNRAWTPSAMLKTASAITGKAYKRGQYAAAIADLESWIADQTARAVGHRLEQVYPLGYRSTDNEA